MKKLVYLVVAIGLVYIGLLTGCKKQSETPSAPSIAPSTNAPAAQAPAAQAPAAQAPAAQAPAAQAPAAQAPAMPSTNNTGMPMTPAQKREAAAH